MFFEVFDVYRHLLRRWVGPAVGMVVTAGIVAYVVSLAIPRTYEATAELLVTPASQATSGFATDVTLGTILARNYGQLVRTETVLEDAGRRLATPLQWTTLLAATQVSQVRDTSIVSIRATATDPQLAAEIANAVADAFIERTKKLPQALQASQSSELDRQIAATTTEIEDLDQQIRSLQAQVSATAQPGRAAPTPDPSLQAQLERLESSRALRQQTLATLVRTRDEAQIAANRSVDSVVVWQRAMAPTGPIAPRPLLNAALAAFSAAVLFAALTFVIVNVDDTIRDPEQAMARMGIPALGVVAAMQDPTTHRGKLVVRDQPTAVQSEAFRSLRTNITFAEIDRPIKTLLVTSTLPGEGKSVVAANLAVSFAQAGIPTILLDADLRRPSQHRLFRINAAVGMTSQLAEGERKAPLTPVLPNLVVIPSGPLPPNPSEVLSSDRLRTFLRELTSSDGITIVDSPPVAAVSDALILAARADAVLLIVESGRTRVNAVRHTVERLKGVQARVIGVVVNKGSREASGYYGYEYGYGSDQKQRQPARP